MLLCHLQLGLVKPLSSLLMTIHFISNTADYLHRHMS